MSESEGQTAAEEGIPGRIHITDLPDELRLGERRDAERYATLKSADIIYQRTTSTMDCVVLNLSDTGALLRAKNYKDCPDAFLLSVLKGHFYVCRVAWRQGCEIGVHFTDQLE